MTEQRHYKTLEDGTIDYAHYMARGRELRSLALFRALGTLRALVRRDRRLGQRAEAEVRPQALRNRPVERHEALAAE